MKLNEKRILVTGSSGFVGKNLVERLKKQGAEVLTLADHDGRRIDIKDQQSVKGIINEIRNIDIVYHLAAITSVPFSFENPRETYDVNVLGTLNILELCRSCNADKIVFASSYVYGQPQYMPIDEEHPLQPANPYARSKVLGEELCRAYNTDFGVKCIILRPFNIYGVGQSKNFLIPSITAQLRYGKIELKDPAPKRDFIYISDVVDAYIKAGESNRDFDVFNIGYGKSYSVEEIVDRIVCLYGKNVKVEYSSERRKHEVMDTVADIRKAKELMGWAPTVPLDEGVRRTMEEKGEMI
ncbi:MAG: GDP-6-deoxy-D-mannose reductase [candidate division WS2 bacterium]|nr:GDP-6-deoxy-D-mannose reductase [Candidatus Psychracetigena formicireducens]